MRSMELDGAVMWGRHDPAIIDEKGAREDVFCVVDDATGGGVGDEVPEVEVIVPGAKEGELAIRGEDGVYGGWR